MSDPSKLDERGVGRSGISSVRLSITASVNVVEVVKQIVILVGLEALSDDDDDFCFIKSA
jgi:hypothetical protein